MSAAEANSKVVCKECPSPQTTGEYCRLHYIKNHSYTRKCTESRELAGICSVMEDLTDLGGDEFTLSGSIEVECEE